MKLTAEQYTQNLQEVCGIEYKAEFVPFSQSRNKDEKHPSLNWRITLGKGGRDQIVTDYMQGIGHLPGYKYKARLTFYEDGRQRKAAESGRVGRKKIPAPKLADVLYCLVMDADVLNYRGFEDWAECAGFDADGRKAKRIYDECLKNALKLNQLIDLREAQEAFEEY